MNLPPCNNEGTGRLRHSGQSYSESVSGSSGPLDAHATPPLCGFRKGIAAGNDNISVRSEEPSPRRIYDRSASIAGNTLMYYAEDAGSTVMWIPEPTDQNRGVFRPGFDPRVEDSSNQFSHAYLSGKFPEITPLISAYSDLDKSISSIASQGSGMDDAVRVMPSPEAQPSFGIRPTDPDAAHAISSSLANVPTLAIPATTSSQILQSPYPYDAVEYQMQTTASTPGPLVQGGKRKITLENYEADHESEILAQKHSDEVDETLEPFEVIMDEGYSFEGCFVLAPTSPDSKKYHSGISQKRRSSKQKPPRKPMGMEDRAAVKQNRIMGVCVRCKMFKEKCRGGFPCQRCCELKIWRTICVTSQLVEKHVFSRGLYRARAAQLSNEVIQDWKDEVSTPGHIVYVSNGYSPTLSLKVYEFEPRNSSLLDHIIWDNTRMSFTRLGCTPYALRSEENQLQHYDKYIDAHLPELVQELEQNQADTIYTRTMKAAFQHYQKKNTLLLRLAFRIWVTQTLFFKGRWRIRPTAAENLGMSTVSSCTSPLFGIMLLPKLLELQLDSILEAKVAELEQHLLANVQNMIFRRSSEEWFIIYLTIFVFLSAVEKDTWNIETWAWSHGIADGDLNWPLADTSPSFFIQKNVALVDILSAHFRSVTRGNIPFTLHWRTELVKQMQADSDAFTYMQTVGEQITNSSSYLKARRTANYNREDEHSLDLKLSSKLMINEDYGNE